GADPENLFNVHKHIIYLYKMRTNLTRLKTCFILITNTNDYSYFESDGDLNKKGGKLGGCVVDVHPSHVHAGYAGKAIDAAPRLLSEQSPQDEPGYLLHQAQSH